MAKYIIVGGTLNDHTTVKLIAKEGLEDNSLEDYFLFGSDIAIVGEVEITGDTHYLTESYTED